MCGIVGVIDFSRRRIAPQVLASMTDAIRHRGPDDGGYAIIDQSASSFRTYAAKDSPQEVMASQGVFDPKSLGFSGNAGFSHRRFSILDLTGAGHQPFVDATNDFCLVFNGEIYNYVELREELEGQGVSFRSRSDTEVVLEGYKAWGVECFKRFNGFWALALYDARRNRLIISRDRLGKKPLYWTKVDTRFYFASEVKALLQVPEIADRRKVNRDALWYWCVMGKRDLGCDTLFKGIHTFPAASWAVVDKDFPGTVNGYWEPPKQRLNEADISVSEASATVRELLEDAVRIRLRADVPLAVDLSGGLDSSSVLALAAQIHPQRLTTFTVKFSDPRWNEEPYARSVARHYNVDYRVIEPALDTFWDDIGAFTYLEEEPYHSPNLQTSQVVWSLMRAEGIKVSLTGSGGDELFAGYKRYFPMAQSDNLRSHRYLRYFDNALHWAAWQPNVARALVRECKRPLRYWIKGHRHPIRNAPETPYLRDVSAPAAMEDGETLGERLYSDITNTMFPYWFLSGDQGYMGIPFEPRSPMLDYRVVETAMQLPETYLVRHGWQKWILRKALEDSLPADVLWRKRKMGFPFPKEEFYKKYDSIFRHILNKADNPYINLAEVHDARWNYWQLISFVLWYELFFNENVSLFDEIEQMIRKDRKSSDLGYKPVFMDVSACGGASFRCPVGH